MRRRMIVLFTALLSALLLGALERSSLAQKDGGGSGLGHWVMTSYDEEGVSQIGDRTFTWPGGDGFDHSIMYSDLYRGQTVSMSLFGTATYTFKWLDDVGNPAPNPPHVVFLKEEAGAGWNGYEAGGTEDDISSDGDSASDGFGDTYYHDKDETGVWGQCTTDPHPRLVQVDGSSGTIVRTANISCSTQVSLLASAPADGWVTIDFDYSVSIDTRGVYIESNVDPTYKKGPDGSQVLNVRDPDGTMHGDTLAPSPGASWLFSYSANDAGIWGYNSEYHWYSDKTDYWDSGTFCPAPIPDLAVNYSNGVSGNIRPGDTDRLYIHAIDSLDGASAQAYYFMTFHELGENIQTTVDVTQAGTATRITQAINPGPQGGSYSFTVSTSVSVTNSADAEASLTAEFIAAKLGFTLGETYQSQVGNTVTFNLQPNMYNWVVRTPFHKHREGVGDAYDAHGYEGAQGMAH